MVCTLRCQINGGAKINGGGGKFLKILINWAVKINGGGGWEFSEKLMQQSRDHTIRQDARVMEYDF